MRNVSDARRGAGSTSSSGREVLKECRATYEYEYSLRVKFWFRCLEPSFPSMSSAVRCNLVTTTIHQAIIAADQYGEAWRDPSSSL